MLAECRNIRTKSLSNFVYGSKVQWTLTLTLALKDRAMNTPPPLGDYIPMFREKRITVLWSYTPAPAAMRVKFGVDESTAHSKCHRHPETLTFETDRDDGVTIQHPKYLGQKSFRASVVVRTHRLTHTEPTATFGPLN